MKKPQYNRSIRVIIITLFCALLLAPAVIMAEPPEKEEGPDKRPSRRGGPDGERKERFEERRERMEKALSNILTEDELERLKAAHEALREDPELMEMREQLRESGERNRGLMREMRELRREKLLEIDPSLEPVMEKVRSELENRREKRGEGRGIRGRRGPEEARLNEADRETLLAARDQAREDGEVTAARDKAKAAEGDEEKAAARAELRRAVHDAMVNADPAVAEILDGLKKE